MDYIAPQAKIARHRAEGDAALADAELMVATKDVEGAKGELRRARKAYGLGGCFDEREPAVSAVEKRVTARTLCHPGGGVLG